MNKETPPVIGFLSAANYYDRGSWSGILFHMHKALKESGRTIVDLGNPHQVTKIEGFKRKLQRFLRCSDKTPKPGTGQYVEKYKEFARLVAKQLEKHPCDILFAPAGSAELFFLETKLPVIYLSDVTFRLFSRHYHTGLTPEETAWKEVEEKTTIRKAAILIYPSAWAARSAVEDYQANPASIEIVPFGANMEEVPEAKAVAAKKFSFPCRLLWVGRDWDRKGGQVAVETLLSLKKNGLSANLTIVGCVPPENIPPEDITVIHNINKNIPEQRDRLNALYQDSHFFVFPTRADCSPIVLCEAAAYGLPVLAADVGGIPSIIEHGKNGYLLSPEAHGDEYAALIAGIIADQEDPSAYSQLVVSSRNAYECRLNWAVWAESFRAAVEKTLQSR